MPVAKLTRRTLAALKAGEKPIVVYDEDLKGFGLRIMPTGKKTWIVEYRPHGGGRGVAKKRIVVGSAEEMTPEEARKAAGKLLAGVRLGNDPAAERKAVRKAVTLRELADTFMSDHVETKRKASTAESYGSILKLHVLPDLGSKKAAHVTTSDLARIHLKLKHIKYRANRVLAVVASMYNFGQKHGLVPKGFNPAEGIEKYREEGREEFLSSDDLARIGEAIREAETVGIAWEPAPDKKTKHAPKDENRRTKIDQHAAGALRLLLLTGARLREILHLRWTDIDFERGVLRLPDSKTGKKAIVLNAPALAVLNSLPRIGVYVIAGATAGTKDEKPRSDLKRPKAAIWKRAGLSGVRLHDLRHTHASFGADAGFSLPMIGKLLGHTQASTTERYAHLTNDPLRKASERIAGDIAAAMGDAVDSGAEVVPMRQKR